MLTQEECAQQCDMLLKNEVLLDALRNIRHTQQENLLNVDPTDVEKIRDYQKLGQLCGLMVEELRRGIYAANEQVVQAVA